jgi:hypothetical protein
MASPVLIVPIDLAAVGLAMSLGVPLGRVDARPGVDEQQRRHGEGGHRGGDCLQQIDQQGEIKPKRSIYPRVEIVFTSHGCGSCSHLLHSGCCFLYRRFRVRDCLARCRTGIGPDIIAEALSMFFIAGARELFPQTLTNNHAGCRTW